MKKPVSAIFALTSILGACSAEPPESWDMNGTEAPGPSATEPGVTSPVGSPNGPVTPGVSPTTGGTTGPTATVPGMPTTPDLMIPSGDPIPLKLDGAPNMGQLVRLTHVQWANTVRDLLKLSENPEAAERFAPDAIVGNFSNNEKYLTTSQTLVSDYERAIEGLVEGMTEQQLSRIYSGTDADGFIKTFGRRAYRRPLTDAEVAKYTDVYNTGAGLSTAGSEFLKGAGLVIQTMLQSPFFIYRVELGNPGQPLSGFEVAAKLALAIHDQGPSDSLLDAAQAGQLDSPDGVGAQAQQLLEDEKAVTAMRRFHGETLQFKRFENIKKEQSIVPEFSNTMADSAEEAAYLFFDRILKENGGLDDIFTSTVGYVNPDLAKLYSVNATGQGFQEMDLGESRMGYFSQVPYLLLHSVNYIPDPIHRGVDLGLRMLCAKVDLPPFVPPQPPAPQPGQSNREVIELTTSPEVCDGCHGPYINPLGFAFENFDGLGRWRTEDNGKTVDASGDYPFTEGKKTFSDNKQLMQLLTESEQAHECYTKNLMEFMLGRELKTEDLPAVESLADVSKNDGSLKDLVVELVKSPAFRMNGGGIQ